MYAALLAVRGGVRRGRTILILGPCNAGKTALWLQVCVPSGYVVWRDAGPDGSVDGESTYAAADPKLRIRS